MDPADCTPSEAERGWGAEGTGEPSRQSSLAVEVRRRGRWGKGNGGEERDVRVKQMELLEHEELKRG